MRIFDILGYHPNISAPKSKAHRRNMNDYVDWTGGDLEWNAPMGVEDAVVSGVL
jgi:hypothetical protein